MLKNTETTDHLAKLSPSELSEAYESACAIAAAQYADGCDTTSIDAECDRIEALIYS
jgi:hypothetical protein